MSEFSDNPFQMDEDFISPPDLSRSPSVSMKNDASSQDLPGHVPHNINVKTLRSRMAEIKQNDAVGTTTEEDEMTYEEDLDDKFDANAVNAANAPSQMYTSQVLAGDTETLSPPENFAPVINKIYRLSFPQTLNFGFIKKLKLKAVLCLIPEEYPQEQSEFFEKEGIKLFQLGMSGNKEPFVKISSELITKAMKIVINPENQPILIHCNRGKHRTGCLVGVLRRLQGWSLTIIFDEYRKFAAPKERPMDQQFIELYDEKGIVDYAQENGFLPMAWL